MRKLFNILLGVVLMSLTATPARTQEDAADRVAVSFADPARPGLLKITLVNGGIKVRGYEGKEVIVEARPVERQEARHARRPEGTEGMRRIPPKGAGLTVIEEGNVMSVQVGGMDQGSDLVVQVPRDTSLKLGCVNGGDIRVEGVRGEIEVNNVNGAVHLAGISGSAVAHALNEDLHASFDSVAPGKSMSFSSLNGNIDVTFPADIKANVVIQSEQGEIYSDFDIQREPVRRPPSVKDSREKDGKLRITLDRSWRGTINGGGPEIQFKNFNGNIYLRKAKQ